MARAWKGSWRIKKLLILNDVRKGLISVKPPLVFPRKSRVKYGLALKAGSELLESELSFLRSVADNHVNGNNGVNYVARPCAVRERGGSLRHDNPG